MQAANYADERSFSLEVFIKTKIFFTAEFSKTLLSSYYCILTSFPKPEYRFTDAVTSQINIFHSQQPCVTDKQDKLEVLK